MGLWIKNDDGSIEKVAGSGGSGGGGPHDHDDYAPIDHGHAEYAAVEHDHDEFVHDHDEFVHDHADYLPLTGGTVTGDLEVAGNSNLVVKSYAQRGLVIDRTANENVPGLVELMPSYEADVTAADIKVDGNSVARFRGDKFSRFYGDLQVDGQIRGPQGSQTLPTYSSVDDPTSGFYAGNFGSAKSAAISVDGVYRVHVAAGQTRITNDLQVDGTLKLPNARTSDIVPSNAPNLYLTSGGNVRWTTFQAAPKAFAIADGIDTAEVLERAETATMPVVDDEGVATTDAEVESITVNEVVTALLAKVKELSARIEELEGN